MLGSSVDPEKLSLTVKSLGLMIVPVIVVVAKMFGVELAEAELVTVVTALATTISSLGIVYGFGRKLYLKFKK